MARRSRHPKKGGRVTPKGTRPPSSAPSRARDEDDSEPKLLRELRRATAENHPLALLEYASMLLTTLDVRREHPFDREDAEQPLRERRETLLKTFLAARRYEITALLAAIAAITPDDLERARIRREIADRPDRLPRWLGGLGGIEVYRAVEMVDVLGDGEDVVVGARLPTGEELTAVVYIDHNMGGVVKDAFVVPDPIDATVRLMQATTDERDTTFNDLSLADARARITEAIATGAITISLPDTDSWPACRPLVEWITRLLPTGGRGHRRHEWSDDELERLSRDFFSSRFATDLGGRDHADLVDNLLWFGSGYGPGDPMRWSPVVIEILLADWIPRKIVADVAYLDQAPDVLRAFVRFCHDARGIRPERTAETLAAIDEWEPEYQRAIRTPRPQGPAASLAAMGDVDADGEWEMPLDELVDWEAIRLDSLRRAVGGDEALAHLDDEPLPDEPFVWDGIPDDVRDRVGEVLAMCDRCCDALLDSEYRTACRRLLVRIATGDANVFRRKGRSETAAAAVCWTVGRANRVFAHQGTGTLLVSELAKHFRVEQSGVASRANTLLKAGGFGRSGDPELRLGSPDYLVSGRRRAIINQRDQLQSEP